MKFPVVSIWLMIVFIVGGSTLLLLHWPQGPANLNWGVWIVVYGGYPFIVCAALLYVILDK